MKKIFVVFMSLMFITCLTGCNESQDKVNIDFIIDGESHLVQIEKGSTISKDIVPLSNKEKDVELYLDENMENKYDNGPLNGDVKIYVEQQSQELIINFQIDLIKYINVTVNPSSSSLGIIFDKGKIEEKISQFNNIICKRILLNQSEFEKIEKEENKYVINVFGYNNNSEKIIINNDGSFYYYNGSYYISNTNIIDFNNFK